MENIRKLYDVVYEPLVINVNSTELPEWAIPVLIACGAVIATAVIVKLIKGKSERGSSNEQTYVCDLCGRGF